MSGFTKTDTNLRCIGKSLCNIFVFITSVGNNNISDEGAMMLARSLKSNTALARLRLVAYYYFRRQLMILVSLSSNVIGDEGAGKLAEVLVTNKRLTLL